MKMRIVTTVEFDDERKTALVTLAKNTGHGYGTPNERDLIRRYLTSKVENAVTYCVEHASREE